MGELIRASAILTLVCVCVTPTSGQDNAPQRVQSGLQALYDFSSTQGTVIYDRSGVRPPLNLRIETPKTVRRAAGRLEIRGTSRIKSEKPATRLNQAIRRSSAITVEAWVRPAKTDQSGPARIVTLSQNSTNRNLTLGQDSDRYDVRLRTRSTSTNGIPSTASARNAVKTALTHIVYTRNAAGQAVIHINGQRRGERKVAGKTNNWNEGYHLAIADEVSGGRPWLGTLDLVAIYSRALQPREILQNFKAGAGAAGNSPALVQDKRGHFFESRIAPLLAHKCLDCHDSFTHKGRLDLSRKDAAFKGGENGKAIVAGKSASSLLWEKIENGDMPPEEESLTDSEKALVKRWIDEGAVWTIDQLDPAVYALEQRATSVVLQRLTVKEYIETVRSAVGVDISKEARDLLPPDIRADGFSNTAYNLNVDLKHVEAYARVAEIVVSKMDVLKFASRFSKSRKLSTDDTMRDFVSNTGKWLLRGPLDDREVSLYSGIATTVASTGGDYKEAVTYIVEAMLQSPRFIYRVENQRGDGTAWPADDYELASRMSYIMWGAPPDAALMKAADENKLSDPQHVREQLQRMLKDPRAIDRSAEFISEWLDLDRLENMSPNAERFPTWEPELAADMRAETLAFFKEIAWTQQRPLSDLLNAQVTFATPRLAKHYGLQPQGAGLRKYDLRDVPARGGLLTQSSILTAGGDDASMVTRGLFVLRGVLRGTVKDPPPGLDTTPVPSKPGLSQRGIAEDRIKNAACGACHSKFEPLAFGLEKFDGLGIYRNADEFGNKLRDDGEILFPGDAQPIRYKNSAELMNLLAESERVRQSLTWKLTQFALGRPLTAADARSVQKIHQTGQKNGGTYASLISAIVLSDLVQMTRTEADDPETTK